MRYLSAVVQLTSTGDVEASLAAAEAGTREAAERGARLVALPEAVAFLGPEALKAGHAEPLGGPICARLSRLAEETETVLLAGSIPERAPDPERPYNTALAFGPDGRLLGSYRKMHLFDVDLRPEGPELAESRRTTPGDTAVVVDTPLGRVGMSVCYDLRFPELYARLVEADAELIIVPSAFTVPTGAAHWEVLLRARAIETQSYVLAAAQVGHASERRESYGHSLIVDPWGAVIAEAPDGPSVAMAEIDLDHLRRIRRRMPFRSHRSDAVARPALVAEPAEA